MNKQEIPYSRNSSKI